MTRSYVLLVSLALIGLVSVQPSTEAFRQSDSQWTTLFDGSSLMGGMSLAMGLGNLLMALCRVTVSQDSL